jgi:uncharacterized protein YlaI
MTHELYRPADQGPLLNAHCWRCNAPVQIGPSQNQAMQAHYRTADKAFTYTCPECSHEVNKKTRYRRYP